MVEAGCLKVVKRGQESMEMGLFRTWHLSEEQLCIKSCVSLQGPQSTGRQSQVGLFYGVRLDKDYPPTGVSESKWCF